MSHHVVVYMSVYLGGIWVTNQVNAQALHLEQYPDAGFLRCLRV